MRTFFRIVKQANLKSRFFALYLLFTLLFVFFNLINFTALIPILEVLFNEVEASVSANNDSYLEIEYYRGQFYTYLQGVIMSEGKMAALVVVCLIVMVSVLMANLFRYLADLCLVEVRVGIIYNLRKSIFNKLIDLPLSFAKEQKKGDLLTRVMNDIQEIETSVIYTLKVYLKEPILIIGFLIILFSMSISLALYSLILIPISGLIISSIAKRLKKKAIQTQTVIGEIGFVLDQMISGIREIKSYGAQPFMSNQFERRNQEYAQFGREMGKNFQLAGPVSEVLGVATMIIILLVGGQIVLSDSGELTASQFIAFLIIFSQVLQPVKAISQAHSLMQRGIASASRVFEIVDIKPTDQSNLNSISVDGFKNELKFENVGLSHDGKEILKDINLEIKRGETIAIVGPSGSGKSSLVDLIPRFHDPTSGVIKWDNIDIKDFDLNELRRHIGVVSQDTVLFNDTVKNNITLGLEEVSDEDVIHAIVVANAIDFVEQLPHGLESIIGERGSKLSGGERQRIAIARAVLKNAPILILDEATSALDEKSATLIQEALYGLTKDKTVIVIAHQLNSALAIDRVVHLRDRNTQGRV